MISAIRLKKSGFNFVDNKWGGFYEGGSYLVIGARKSGRTLLALQAAIASAQEGETCLFFTNMRPKDLMIQAAALNFDIQAFMDENLIIVVRVASPEEVYAHGISDEYLAEYLNDILTVTAQYNPQRIIFDELTHYIGFKNLNALRATFLHVLETIEDRDITSIFVVAEPATKRTNEIIDVIANNVTGVIYLKKGVKKISGKYYGGSVVITPNVGHTEGQFSDTYKIEPYRGVIVDLPDQLPIVEKQVDETEEFVREYDVAENEPAATTVTENKPEPAQRPKRSVININAPNVYSYNDFSLILNNQIALFKSAGQRFNLVSFSVSKALLEEKNISFDQVKAAIIEATERREKVCYIDDIVLVLIPRSTDDRVAQFVLSVKDKLISYDFPEEDFNFAIKLFNYEVDDKLDRADTILDYLTSPTTTENLYISMLDFLK
jgi:KaiC/GvpD/RAD55 family RecA-like ATPase